jgi:CheY-like chemotaxis protein
MDKAKDVLNVLLVDDCKDFRLLMKEHFEQLHYKVTEADDGYEALQLLKQHQFYLTIMDLKMPLLDGISTARSFREWESQQNRTPARLVALTAFSLPMDRDNTIKAGFDEFMRKPYDCADLGPMITRMIG